MFPKTLFMLIAMVLLTVPAFSNDSVSTTPADANFVATSSENINLTAAINNGAQLAAPRDAYTYCAVGDRRYPCEQAAYGNSYFVAEGCIGSVGEGTVPALTPSNIYRVYLRYGYQQRPRRAYNNVNQPTWYYTADSYDWACVYTAVRHVR